MARKKVILREQILDAAYHIVKTSGFHRLTARHIANDMHCSTQPIYLEFANMVDLKQQVYYRIEKEMMGWMIRKEPYDSDPLISLCFGYIEFANVETGLYKTISVDQCEIKPLFQDFIRTTFLSAMTEDEKYANLPREKKEAMLSQLWLLTTGIASATASHLVDLNKEMCRELLENQIQFLLEKDSLKDVFD